MKKRTDGLYPNCLWDGCGQFAILAPDMLGAHSLRVLEFPKVLEIVARHTHWPPWRERVLQFWTGPLRRYVPGCTAVEVRLDLAPPAAGSLPGGYAVEATARAAVRGEPAREFSIFRLRRYEPLGLARALRELGWDALDGWPYGGGVGYPRALSLFVRRGDPVRARA